MVDGGGVGGDVVRGWGGVEGVVERDCGGEVWRECEVNHGC